MSWVFSFFASQLIALLGSPSKSTIAPLANNTKELLQPVLNHTGCFPQSFACSTESEPITALVMLVTKQRLLLCKLSALSYASKIQVDTLNQDSTSPS